MKRLLSLVAVLSVAAVLVVGCGGKKDQSANGAFKAAMVTDVGGINDQSFNQSAWGGMEKLKSEGVTVSFLESHRGSDYAPNLEKSIDAGADIIWAIGFMMKDPLQQIAQANPDQLFALVDDTYPDGTVPNVIGVTFKAEQSSFEVGYIAAYMTKTNHVGFIIGMESPVMNRFKYGYFAGVQYAAKEMGKKIQVDYQIMESFTDAAKGKAAALKMYTSGADVIFHAAGGVGQGVIEAAKERNLWVIGVDLDQNYMAPDNVITSALKNVDIGVYDVTKRVMAGEKLGGTTVEMGLSDGGVGIAPTSGKLVPADILQKTKDIENKIIDGQIIVPITDAQYQQFIKGL